MLRIFCEVWFFPTDWQHQTMFDSSGLLTLHYGKHHMTLIDEIRAWFDGECFADVALVCEGKETLRAHRLVLASSSPLIKQVLQETPSAESPVIIQFPGVRATDMRLLLDFLYTGQAYVQVYTGHYVLAMQMFRTYTILQGINRKFTFESIR
jgi:hypothetical protein